MCEIHLLRGEIAIVDEADFEDLSRRRWYLNGGYPVTRDDKKPILMHVLLMGRAPDGHHTDHINRNKLDNRRGNLRIVTAAENIRNRRSYAGASNPFFGRTHSKEIRMANARRCGRRVLQLDLDSGELIREWPNAMEVQRQLGINNAGVTAVANGRGHSAGGFFWRRP